MSFIAGLFFSTTAFGMHQGDFNRNFENLRCSIHNCKLLDCHYNFDRSDSSDSVKNNFFEEKKDCQYLMDMMLFHGDDREDYLKYKKKFWTYYQNRNSQEQTSKSFFDDDDNNNKRSGVDMNKRTIVAGFATAALFAGGTTSGMNYNRMTISELNNMLAGNSFNLSHIITADDKIKKEFNVNTNDNPRVLPLSQKFTQHCIDMNEKYKFPPVIAFIQPINSGVFSNNEASMYDAREIINFWTIYNNVTGKKVLPKRGSLKDPRTYLFSDNNGVKTGYFYQVVLGENISKGDSTTKGAKEPSKKGVNASDFEINADELSSLLDGEDIGERVDIRNLIKLKLLGTLSDLVSFLGEKTKSNNDGDKSVGQMISLFSKASSRVKPSLKSMFSLSSAFMKQRPEIAIGLLQRLQDQGNTVKKNTHREYQIKYWENMVDHYEKAKLWRQAINVCKFVGKSPVANTSIKIKADEKRSMLEAKHNKSTNNDPTAKFANAFANMMGNIMEKKVDGTKN